MTTRTGPLTNEVADTDTRAFIRIEDLSVSYGGGALALDRLRLTVAEGEFLCVCGPSGCGKSTLMQVLSGLLPPTTGTVEIAGRRLYASGRPEYVGVGYVFQDHRLLPWRRVRANLEITLAAAGVPREQWDERIGRTLQMLQIEQFANAWPLRLSGGQRQRAAIARALVVDPDVLLMDEPFSTLDEVTGRALRTELVEVWARTRKTVVFVTHSIREALFLADRVVLLTPGPGRLLETFPVTVPRPRDYEDVELARLEQQVVEVALRGWGMAR